mgnify:CR=1 FL=1
MTFSQLLHAVRLNPHAVVIPSVWGQGRAGFGGLAVALVFEAMRAKVPNFPFPERTLDFRQELEAAGGKIELRVAAERLREASLLQISGDTVEYWSAREQDFKIFKHGQEPQAFMDAAPLAELTPFKVG